MLIRRAEPSEAEAATQVLIDARHAAIPSIPPLAHPDDEVLAWFTEHVMTTMDVWVASEGSTLLAVMVLTDGWLEQLYVRPGATNRGLGSALVARAKAETVETADTLQLWTFASNFGAQRFYRRHGFVEQQRTDGDNEEGEPDIRYQWSRPPDLDQAGPAGE